MAYSGALHSPRRSQTNTGHKIVVLEFAPLEPSLTIDDCIHVAFILCLNAGLGQEG